MSNAVKHAFLNQSARAVRGLLVVTAICYVPALFCGLVAAYDKSKGGAAAGADPTLCVILAMILGSFGTAMLLSALMTIPASRRIKRAIASFDSGDFLAHWEYPDAFWQEKVAAATKNANKQAWTIFVMLFLFFGFVGMMPVWASPDVKHKIAWSVVVLLICGALGWVGRWATFKVMNAKRRRMLTYPEAFLSRQAIYCAGEIAFWGTHVRALQSIRVTASHEIEVVVGMTKGMKKAVGAVDAVNAIMLHPTYSGQSQRLVVPIPPGEEKNAAEIVREILAGVKV